LSSSRGRREELWGMLLNSNSQKVREGLKGSDLLIEQPGGGGRKGLNDITICVVFPAKAGIHGGYAGL